MTLPVFMFVVLKARTEQLFRSYYFIKKFRYQLRRETRDPIEFRYTLTTLKIAVRFLSELTPDKLKLSAGESVPQLEMERKHASTQTAPRETELEERIVLRYTGPVDVAFLLARPEALEAVLEDYSALRAFYAGSG